MAAEGMPSLAEFAAAQVSGRSRKWCDDLPDDVKAQILSADGVPSRVIAEWLKTLGYADATYAKVDGFRRDRARP